MAMEISSGVTSQIMDLKTSSPGVTRKEEIKTGFKNVDEYLKYLQDKYSYMNTGKTSMQGVPTTVVVSEAFLRKCKDDPEKAAFLEENLAAIPNCAKMAVNSCFGTLTNLQYKCDANGNLSVAISGTNDPDGKIARENAKRKVEEEKAAKAKLEKKRAEKKAEEEAAKESIEKRAEKQAENFSVTIIGTDLSNTPDYIAAAQKSASARGTTLKFVSIEFGEEYSTMTTMTVTDGGGTDSEIDKWLERLKEKKEEKKIADKKLEKKMAEEKRLEKATSKMELKGRDLEDLTNQFVANLSGSLTMLSTAGFDAKA